MLLQWTKELAIGHPIIDYDHQMLVNIANDLHHAVKFDQGDEEVERSLARLIQYIETHFAREEALFDDSHYPHKEKHKKNHRDIEGLVRGFLTAFQADPEAVQMDKLLTFLKEWLLKHIGNLDRGYAEYVLKAEKKSGHITQKKGFV
ncbi:bacteriohemerythrin [Pseudomonadota bacterium]